MKNVTIRFCCLLGVCFAELPRVSFAQTIQLPSSKEIVSPVPGEPQQINSLPMMMAVSPDRRYVAVVNAGFGTAESDYQQSIAIFDRTTGKVSDFPDQRTGLSSAQTLYSGVAFSLDGQHLYASLDSLTAPEGDGGAKTGNAVAVYRFSEGQVTPERLIPIPLQPLAGDRIQNQLGKPIPSHMAIPVPTGIAVVRPAAGGPEQLLVADEFSDDVLLLDSSTGRMVTRFDLARGSLVPTAYPIAVAATQDGRRAFVALWNGSAVTELDLVSGRVGQTLPLLPPARPTAPSSHATALALSADSSRLYVALANRDSVAQIDLRKHHMRVSAMYDTRLPGQQYFGAIPSALALGPDGKDLYVANSGSDAVAVFHLATTRALGSPIHASGFIPTEWFPTSLAVVDGKLLIATAKGKGTGPNIAPQRPALHTSTAEKRTRRPHTYIATLLYGSLASVDLAEAQHALPALSSAVVVSNRMLVKEQHLQFASGGHPIRHVIYIIKENRTYDQIFGDLGVGDGEPSLTMYGASITPNQHKLARQFGVIDNFYDSGEVSGDGHVWSTAAITSDYTEKNWQQAYRGGERMYDYEGVVEQGYPLQEGIPDIDEPGSGYLWTDLARHGKSLYHFGEFVSTKFCDDSGEAPKDRSPLNGTPEPAREPCPRADIQQNQAIPAMYGGGSSPYPWRIPLIYRNVATKPELVGHFDPDYPDFNLKFPDQLRFEEFQRHLRGWEADRARGNDTMPQFVMLRFANDHTAGTTPGAPTPMASVADNDLAVGRAVDAISHSPYWDDTAFFIIEDDAQDGADHVDAHRSTALVISKYAQHATEPVVDHTFYTTVSILRTIEDLMGVPPMNNNDAFAPLMQPLFTGTGNQPPFRADYANRDNGLVYQANTPKSPGAKQSSRMDFTHEDRADAKKLNVILWRDAMGTQPVPQMLLHPHKIRKDDDDD